jgi:hypothetical protein
MSSEKQYEFQKLIDRLSLSVLALSNNFQNLKSLEILSFVCLVNRLDQAQQALQQVLEVLAANFPGWLRKIALPHWYGRYNQATRLDAAFLLGQQKFLVEQIGTDIHHLLEEIHHLGPEELRESQEVKTLEQIWSQQFQVLHKAADHWPANLNWKDCSGCLLR